MKKVKNIILLAGGVSQRFWPLTDKTTFVFLDKQLILHQVESLLSLAEKINVVVNEENYQKATVLLKNFTQVNVYKQIKPGQAGAILSVDKNISGEAIVINNNDLFEDNQIKSIMTTLEKETADAFVVAKKMDQYFPGGYIKHAENIVEAIIEKPKENELPSKYVDVGVYYFKAIEEFIKIMGSLNFSPDEWFERAVSHYIQEKKVVKMIVCQKEWYYLKYPWHVLLMKNYFLSKLKSYRGRNVIIDKSAIIEGNVYLDDGVRVMNHAKIVGPCYIGKNSIIGSYAMVIESLVGDGAVIGGYSEVTRSYLGKKVMLHRNYVGDSVLADMVSFGAGAVTANYRFDGQSPKSMIKDQKIISNLPKLGAIIGENSKIGVNATLLPGVKIGGDCLIGPGEVVRDDIKNSTFLFNKP